MASSGFDRQRISEEQAVSNQSVVPELRCFESHTDICRDGLGQSGVAKIADETGSTRTRDASPCRLEAVS